MSTNLGDLLKQAGLRATERSEQEAVEPPPPEGAQFAAKVVLRVTRRGRGGKTVTEVQGVLRDLDDLAKSLRKSLGVGTSVEGELILVQGDQLKRLVPALTELGAKKVVG